MLPPPECRLISSFDLLPWPPEGLELEWEPELGFPCLPSSIHTWVQMVGSFQIFKKCIVQPWPVLSVVRASSLCTKGSRVQFPVKGMYLGCRSIPWPQSGCMLEATNRCVSLTLMFLSLSPPPFHSL
uniref:Uncharacterized protein n=1 Tax=Myotis myotis TaxID=51298 RepID=A0A7J7VI58_MYOMY|nr:hypothetical protein mMyoMyo1_008299 [Myotis myotis]